MNCQSTPAVIPLSRSPLESVIGTVRDLLLVRAGALFAHVRESLRRPGRDDEVIADMNAHMLRDLGIDGSQVSRARERRDLQFPRL